MADQPDPTAPIFEEEILSHKTGEVGPRAVPPLAFAALIIGNIVLAIGPWFVRMADVGPVASGFWRLALAVPFLLLIARASGERVGRIPRKIWVAALIAGAFFAADLSTWHTGILHTKLANATLLGNISSFFFAAYGFIIARTLPSRWQVVAMALAAAGTALLLGRSYQLSPEHLAGDLLCLFAGIAYTGYMIAIDRARAKLGTWTTLSVATIVSSALLLPAAFLIDGSIWPQHWGPLVALAIGSQVIGQGLLVYAIGILSPVIVGFVLLSQPVVAALIGWVVYGENLGATDLAGALAIAVSLVLVRRGRAS